MTGIATNVSFHSHSMFRRFIRCTASVLAGIVLSSAQVVKAEQYGPFDYYDPPKGSLPLVELAHFGVDTHVRARRGDWCGYWSDLDYTLRVFRNHPRALEAMAEYLDEHPPCQIKKKDTSLKDIVSEIEAQGWREKNADYYYETAINFRPKQTAARILYGKYLYKKGRLKEALQQLQDAEKLQPASGETQYYLGMIYADMGNYQNAQSHAVKAYKLGGQPPDLRDKLVKAGAWKDKE